jgi:hypothetical protein
MYQDDSFRFSSTAVISEYPNQPKYADHSPTPKKSLKPSEKSSKLLSNRKSFEKTVKNLDELGFVSSSTNRPMLTEGFEIDKKKSYTIGLADFWTFQDKLRYLKSHGCWAAYKKLMYNKHVLQYTYKKSARNPDLPYVMDHKTVRLVNSMNRKHGKRTQSIRNKLTRISPRDTESSPIVKKIEFIKDECEKAIDQTYYLNLKYFKEKKDNQGSFRIKSLTPTRLVKSDKDRIQRIINNLS